MRHKDIKAYLAWAAVCFFWGTTYLAIRIGVEVLPPALFAGIRFLLAGMIFIPVLRLKGYNYPKLSELKDLAIIGILLLAVANGTVVWAEQWVSSSLAALIIATLPFWMVGIESLIPRGERLTVNKLLGICIGFLGLVVLLWPDLNGATDSTFLKGILALFIAPIAWASGSIYSKYRKVSTQPLMAAAVQTLIAGVVLTGIGLINGEMAKFTLSSQGILALLYLMIFGSIVGYTAYIYALAHLPMAFVSTYAYINPIIAVLLGWLILHERLNWLVLIATTLILAGVLLVRRNGARLNDKVRTQKQPSEKILAPDEA